MVDGMIASGLRWAVVGTGDISRRVIADLREVSMGSITAVWGRSEERAGLFAAEFGIPSWTSELAELLGRGDVDVVYIATPSETHCEIAVQALRAGKHVLIEKPIAMSAAEAREIFDVAAGQGLFAMEAMWMKFNPLHKEIERRVAAGLLGEVSSVRASFGTPFHARGGRTSPAQAGSALRDRGIYTVTLAHWLLGEGGVGYAEGTLLDGVDVRGSAVLRFGATPHAQLAWSGTEFLDLSAAVSGDRGWVEFEAMFWAGTRARIHAGSAERIFVTPEVVDFPRVGNGYQPMLREVESMISDGAIMHPRHAPDATMQVTRTLDSIEQAVRAQAE
ncbi:putative dehydrogenase [Pseudoclavibacter sp. JAI123]|uniref:Gfo/Idh/MocA family protein n=1 Tax=Pseudoclavibacter sp. JAI123 TaxID=2723065 RepID=UPI0015CE50EB|nr:Gfo/Idh/MocA family oxidoreductase [Pseudoclavibacter sp. JAI123]NYF12263.1 putative dehydrogenase [Pseudoclavibacter sp. JAI123]